MNILVIAATIDEIKPSLSFLQEQKINYLVTGVGMLATTYTLTKYLQQHAVDLILQVGIGGILDRNVALGKVFRIKSDEIFGLGAEDHDSFIDITELGFGKSIYKGVVPVGWSLPQTVEARGITVNTVHGSQESIRVLYEKYPSLLVESMEGAALFLVSEQEQIPCLQYRAVSNYIEPRNREAWNIGLAVKNLNVFLQEFLIGIKRA